jgi:hypothetical protein
MANIYICSFSLNLERYSLIWLDSQSNSNEKIKQTQQPVRSSINDFRIFEDADECIKNIQLSTADKMIVIVDEELGKIFIPYVHELSQVIAIYIYDINQDLHRQRSREYSKIKFNKNLE